jgi:polyisoprenoid-binding protein YceI
MDAPDQQAATAPPRGTRTTWVIDPVHSLVEFAVRHLMVTTFKGCFTGVTGTIVLDEVDLSHSRVEVSIDAASVDTRNEQRDAHLRSDDFLEVATYPQIIFASWGVEPEDGERAKVSGDLTIHGVTRLAVLDVKINGRSTTPGGAAVIGFSASTTISRKDYGLTWNAALDAGVVVFSDEVTIQLEIEAVKQA